MAHSSNQGRTATETQDTLGTQSPEDKKGRNELYLFVAHLALGSERSDVGPSWKSKWGSGQREPAVPRDLEPQPLPMQKMSTDAYQALAVATVKYFT